MSQKLFNTSLIVLSLLALPMAVQAQDWNWVITPYGWAASSTVDATVNDQVVFGTEVDFADLLDDVDGGIMLHVEGRPGKLGVFGDLLLIDLGDEPRSYNVRGLAVQAKADPELTMLDLGGTYYPSGEEHGFGFHYGIRIIDIDQEIDIRSIGRFNANRRIISASETFVDGLVGFRFDSELADNWTFAMSADASTGDTENTWSAQAVVGYRVGSRKQNQIRLGYRHYEIELENDAERSMVNTEIAMSGPMVGFSFTF